MLAGHQGLVIDIAVTADGRIVSASTDNTAKVWGADCGRELLTFAGHSGQVLAWAVTAET
jgi:WD40 repeat protein